MSARTSLPVEENPPPPSEANPDSAEEGKPAHVWAPVSVLLTRFSAVALLCWLDVWSKARVFEWLTENRSTLTIDDHGHFRHKLLGEWLTFMKSTNAGAAFGQLDSMPYLLIGGRIVAVLFLCWMILRAPTTRRVFTAALVLVLAGASGNLWDNLFLQPPFDHPFGEVRDFIDVYFSGIGKNGWHFPTFNVADSCITVGAVLLLLSGLGKEEGASEVPEPVREPAPPAV